MDQSRLPSIDHQSWLEKGDRAAQEADWIAAVSSWEAALGTPDNARASARLQWFLESAAPNERTKPRRPTAHLLLIGIATAIAATGLVLLAQHFKDFWRDVSVGVAWLLFIVAAACTIVFAYWQRPHARLPLAPPDVSRAHDLARQASEASATMPTGSRLPT